VSSNPKPLPAGNHRLVRICTCGRIIQPGEFRTWISRHRCPDCYGYTWVWWKRPVTHIERIRAWFELWRWKKRRQKLYGAD